MTWRASIVVYGDPQTKGSTRSMQHPRTGRIITLNDNAKAKPWQESLAWAMREKAPDVPLRDPVAVVIRLFLKRPAHHFGTGRNRYVLKPTAPTRPVVKPDWDKSARVVSDAGSGVWWQDDCVIAEARVEKHYAEAGQVRTEVEAWNL